MGRHGSRDRQLWTCSSQPLRWKQKLPRPAEVSLGGPNFRTACRLLNCIFIEIWWPAVTEMAITSHIKITSLSLSEFISTTSMNLCNTWNSPYKKVCQNNYLLLEENCTTELDIKSIKNFPNRRQNIPPNVSRPWKYTAHVSPDYYSLLLPEVAQACVGRSSWWCKLIQ
jgi:hypothetical protein